MRLGAFLYIYKMVLFFEGTGIWSQGFFSSQPQWDSRNWNFSVKSLRSSVVFGGRLQRPSPCLIRSEPRREREWRLSETSEKLRKCCIMRRSSRAFRFFLTSAASAERDIFQNWHHCQTVVAKVLNFAVVYSGAFVLLDVCRA